MKMFCGLCPTCGERLDLTCRAAGRITRVCLACHYEVEVASDVACEACGAAMILVRGRFAARLQCPVCLQATPLPDPAPVERLVNEDHAQAVGRNLDCVA